jgi:hypothetical protein
LATQRKINYLFTDSFYIDNSEEVTEMKRILVFCLSILAMSTILFSQVPVDKSALLNGEEGTQSAVADNIGYPAPRRVLDLSSTLNLTESQRNALRDIISETSARTKELGKRIIKIEEELSEAYKAGFVTQQSVSDDCEQIGKLRGKLRGVFLSARIATKKLLTASQIDMYKKLSVPPTKK